MTGLMTALSQGDPQARRLLGGGLGHDELLLRARMLLHAPCTADVVDCIRSADADLPDDPARRAAIAELEKGAVVVIAGQQPGLFAGPLLTLAKAAAAVRLARTLRAEGVPAVALFWSASEDHDFAEAARCFRRSRPDRPEPSWFELEIRSPTRSLHQTILDENDRRRLADLAAEEGIAEDCLPRPDETFGAWQLRLLARLTAGSGLILVEPHRFAQILVPFRRNLLTNRLELIDLMRAASTELEIAGFAAPLALPGPETSFHFLSGPEGRQRLDAEPPGWRAGSLRLEAAALDRILVAEPERLSSAAAARPLAQQALFPVVAQISGPTEGAYMAQLMPLFGVLGLPRPLVRPRPALLVLDHELRSLADRLGLEGPARSWDLSPPSFEAPELDRVETGLRQAFQGIENHPDPFLRRELVSYRRSALADLRQLRKAWLKEARRQDRDAARARHRLRHELRFDHGGQDRALGVFAFGLPLDGAFFARVVTALDDEALDDLQIDLED